MHIAGIIFWHYTGVCTVDIGTIKSIEKDGDALICTIDFGADDVTTATLYGLSSQNDYPMIDDSAVVSRGDDDVIVSIFRPCPSDLATGESIVYGRDSSGAIISSVRMGADGVVKINGGGRTVAAFEDLKTGFNLLKTNLNSLIAIFNAHVHTAPSTPTVTPGTPSTATIDLCQSDTVEVP